MYVMFTLSAKPRKAIYHARLQSRTDKQFFPMQLVYVFDRVTNSFSIEPGHYYVGIFRLYEKNPTEY
jgi:hypothetical protein